MKQDETDGVVLVQAHQIGAAQERIRELQSEAGKLAASRAELRSRMNNLEEQIRAAAAAAGVEQSLLESAPSCSPPELNDEEIATIDYGVPRFRPLETPGGETWTEYVIESRKYAATYGLDLTIDPVRQLLSPARAAEVARKYDSHFGSLPWTRWDYGAVALAGSLAALVDIAVVSIPSDMEFLGKQYKGSPITKWLRDLSKTVNAGTAGSPLLRWASELRRGMEAWAKVPYDIPTNAPVSGIQVPGLRPKMHRLMSPGHDPAITFVWGLLDILRGTCSLIDRRGRLHIIANGSRGGLLSALVKPIIHVLSDIPTPAGVQPPFFTLVQCLAGKSPFALRAGGERVSYPDVARWMYGQGYTMEHFATMSLVPVVVELVIRTYFRIANFETLSAGPPTPGSKAKLASLLAMAHTLASGGNALKMHLFGWNPTALNWAEMLACGGAWLQWLHAEQARQRAVEDHLDCAWRELYLTTTGCA